VQLEFIRPGQPVENGYIESFDGRRRDEGLNVEVFFALADCVRSSSAGARTTTRDDRTAPCMIARRRASQRNGPGPRRRSGQYTGDPGLT
jgi:hypothetical protein